MDAAFGWNRAYAADVDGHLAVGAELMALTDVTLAKAAIVKGSRVSVSKLVYKRGHLDAINVVLPDGHVVMVSLEAVRSSFQLVES